MSRIPRSVEMQAELAEQLHKKAYGTPQNPSEAPSAGDNAPSEQAANNDSSASGQELAKPDSQKIEDQAPEEGDLNHWRHRAKVAEGRLSKEMPRMAQTIRELKDQLLSAQTKLTEAQTVAAKPVDSGVKPEEVEQYGNDFIDMVTRVARSATNVDPTLAQKVDAVEQKQLTVTRQQFFEQLGRDAPQWESLNTNEGFLSYLDSLDPYTGRQRKEIFDDAYGKLDAWRVANFFNSFADSQQSQSVSSPTPSLADQVVPSGNRSSAPPPGKRVWNNQQIARFYDEMRRGVHTQEQADLIEKDIFAARSEGRLR